MEDFMAAYYPISKDDAALVVRDQTDFFNSVRAQNGTDYAQAHPAETMSGIVKDFAKVVDFRCGSEIAGTVVRSNALQSFELNAIEMVDHIRNTRNAQGFSTIYSVMNETRARMNLPVQFRLSL
jgi:hypothetical protein